MYQAKSGPSKRRVARQREVITMRPWPARSPLRQISEDRAEQGA